MSQPLQPALARSRVEPAAPRPPERRLHELYFPKHLMAVVRRERARADRQKGQFCLVMFRLVPAGGRFAMLRLSRVVMQETRTTDEVGLYDRHTVCAILPDTQPEGAWMLIRRTRDMCRQRKMVVEPVVYTYPTDWIERDDHHNGGNGNGNGGGGGECSPFKPQPGDNLRIAADADADSPSGVVETLPLEVLLSRPPGAAKRAMDVIVSAAVLLAVSPILALIAAVIKLGDRGPVFFCQARSGLGGRPFKIFKFRTMNVNAEKAKAALRAQSEQDGPAFKMTRDPRVTAVGKFLRKTSLDELPQLFNVLRGDMSLVGPRPLPIDEQRACDVWHRARLDVMPGLTCVWQVKGRSRVSFDEWMRMDLSYAKKDQVTNDLKLMLQTIPAVLFRRGAK